MAAYYGKLPAKGDFLSRNLPREFVDRWDDWLQSGMHSSRDVLGDDWLQIYLTSPLWRFVLPAGVCGSSSWTGVLMPSMDKVGRYFPMTVVRTLPAESAPICIAIENNHWFEAVEDALLAALEDETLDLDSFEQRLDSIEFTESEPARLDTQLEPNGGARVPLSDSLDISHTLLGLGIDGVRSATSGFGFWWGSGSDSIPPSLLYSSTLPLPQMFTAMLSGNWSAHGWRDGAATTLPDMSGDPLARLVDELVD